MNTSCNKLKDCLSCENNHCDCHFCHLTHNFSIFNAKKDDLTLNLCENVGKIKELGAKNDGSNLEYMKSLSIEDLGAFMAHELARLYEVGMKNASSKAWCDWLKGVHVDED